MHHHDKAMMTIVWFRLDLRLEDNPAFNRAIERKAKILPLYILEENKDDRWKMGGATRWWLHYALEDLSDQIKSKGGSLLLLRGNAENELLNLVAETNADAVYWNRRYDRAGMQVDSEIKSQLNSMGVEAQSSNASLIFEPWTVASKTGNPYKVFTPFYKTLLERNTPVPEQMLSGVVKWSEYNKGFSLDAYKLLPKISWDKIFFEKWKPQREVGLGCLKNFIDKKMDEYNEGRDIPSEDGTSNLSPYLHFGQIGPREVYAQIKNKLQSKGAQIFQREILWREFAYNILYHFPNTPTEPLNSKHKNFPWIKDEKTLRAWQRGYTGYPIVDAGMRQLWATGWMHNRVRMIVGSFLVKHLLHSWEDGAVWFWDCLVDADLASNTLGWQWVGGCGADAAPYFRIFNPTLQGEKFDPEGEYVKHWIPELKSIPPNYIHKPWKLSESEQEYFGVLLGKTYPKPMIDHNIGRERALSALKSIK